MPKPDDPTQAVCGDPLCAAGKTGTCSGANIRLCGNDGRVAANATACATGVCVGQGNPVGGLVPGQCQAECQPGDETCLGGAQFETCGSNGRWGTPQNCSANDAGLQCVSYTTTVGRPAKICGAECGPGSRQCLTSDGGVNNDSIQTCNSSGLWDPPVACSIGVCTTNAVGNSGAACVAQCVPNQAVCTGDPVPIDGTDLTGSSSFATCTADGKLPALGTDCAGGTACRKGLNGIAISVSGDACIQCVGPNVAGGNERGQVDVRCSTNAGDDVGNEATQLCAADNTWTGAVTACQANTQCTNIQSACGRGDNGHEISETHYKSVTCNDFGCSTPRSCQSTMKDRGNLGPPILCGSTPDCCTNGCIANAGPGPAACRPVGP
jgi:hypothetical protein